MSKSEKLTLKVVPMSYKEYSSVRLHRGQKGYYQQQKEIYGIKDFNSTRLKTSKTPNLDALKAIATKDENALVNKIMKNRMRLALGLYEMDMNERWRDNFSKMIEQEYGVSKEVADRIRNFPIGKVDYLEKLMPEFDAWYDSGTGNTKVSGDKVHYLGTDEDYDTYFDTILDYAYKEIKTK